MNHKEILFFDIETEINSDALPFIPEPTAPSNYKDAEKIAAYIAEKKEEQLNTAALDADLGKVTAISLRHGVEGETKVYLIGDPEAEDEKTMLSTFWAHFSFASGLSCGFNIIGFDFPYLMRRSMDLGVKLLNAPPFLAKYRTEPTTDLMGILFNWGPSKGLKWTCRRYGIDNPLPDLDGSMYAAMDEKTKRMYSGNDIHLTVGLYKRMAGIYFPSIR